MDKNKDDRIIVDWFSFTSKIDSQDTIIHLLGLEHIPWQHTTGAKGFSERLYFSGISIHFNNLMYPELVWLEMSGKGCRCFEDYGEGDFDLLFDYVNHDSASVRLKRLDIAFDDFSGILDISQIYNDTVHENFVSRCRFFEAIYGSAGTSCVFGSPKSDLRIRIYDKASEQNLNDEHWVRVELQLREDRGFNFIVNYLNKKRDLGKIFSGVLINYLRFVIPSVTDSNKRRWLTADYWDDLISGADRIKLFTKIDREYNFGALKNYVIDQAGQAIKTYLEIEGPEGLQNDLNDKVFNHPNPKYKELLDGYKLYMKNKK